ncbi:hypothetical protein [Wukongibacter baidiensis]
MKEKFLILIVLFAMLSTQSVVYGDVGATVNGAQSTNINSYNESYMASNPNEDEKSEVPMANNLENEGYSKEGATMIINTLNSMNIMADVSDEQNSLWEYATRPDLFPYYSTYMAISGKDDSSWRAYIMKINDGEYNNSWLKSLTNRVLIKKDNNLSPDRAEKILISILNLAGEKAADNAKLQTSLELASATMEGFKTYVLENEEFFDYLFNKELSKLNEYYDQTLESYYSYIYEHGVVPSIDILKDSPYLEGKDINKISKITEKFGDSKIAQDIINEYMDKHAMTGIVMKSSIKGYDEYNRMIAVSAANFEFIELLTILEKNASIKDLQNTAQKLRQLYEDEMDRASTSISERVNTVGYEDLNLIIDESMDFSYIATKAGMNVSYRPESLYETYDEIRIISSVASAINTEINNRYSTYKNVLSVSEKEAYIKKVYELLPYMIELNKKGEESQEELFLDKYSTSNWIKDLISDEGHSLVIDRIKQAKGVNRTILETAHDTLFRDIEHLKSNLKLDDIKKGTKVVESQSNSNIIKTLDNDLKSKLIGKKWVKIKHHSKAYFKDGNYSEMEIIYDRDKMRFKLRDKNSIDGDFTDYEEGTFYDLWVQEFHDNGKITMTKQDEKSSTLVYSYKLSGDNEIFVKLLPEESTDKDFDSSDLHGLTAQIEMSNNELIIKYVLDSKSIESRGWGRDIEKIILINTNVQQ